MSVDAQGARSGDSSSYEILISDRDDGFFLASGSAEALACREGTIDTVKISKESGDGESSTVGAYSDDYGAVEERTLTCGDGSGSIVLGLLIDQSESMSGYSFGGMWLVAAVPAATSVLPGAAH